MSKKAGTIEELIGKDLSGFKIVEMTEVFCTSESGTKTNSLGFFKSSDIADAFVEIQNDEYCDTESNFVLTNEKVGFILEGPVNLFDDEAEAQRIKQVALTKFTPAMRKLLGIS